MKEIWIIGIGHFGLMAVERLEKRYSGHHFVLVDPDRKNLLQGKGPNRTLAQGDGVVFLDRLIDAADAPEWIIPALPIHLAAEWCLLRQGLKGLKRIDIPAEIDGVVSNPVRGSTGDLYVSHADFHCPDDCGEPAKICTVTQKKRGRNMFELLADIETSKFKSICVRSYQLAPGIGGYRPRQLFGLLKRIENIEHDFLLSTACRCHGVMTGLGYC